MMHRNYRSILSRVTSAALTFAIIAGVTFAVAIPASTMVGCKQKKPPPPPPPPPPPAPVVPDPVQVDALMQAAKPDARVQFPQAKAPIDESLAKAVIALADTLAKGDADKLKGMLDDSKEGKPTLEALVTSGEWDDSYKTIEAVRVVFLDPSPNDQTQATSASLALAVQEPGGAYIMGWSASRSGDGWSFKGLKCSASVKARASDWDESGSSLLAVGGSSAAPLAAGTDAAAAAAKSNNPDSGGGEQKQPPIGRPPGTVPAPGGKPITVPGGGGGGGGG